MSAAARLKSTSAVLSAALLLVGCAGLKKAIPTTGIKYIPCVNVDPITYSGANDTPETKEQVQAFNSVYDEQCK